jgi:dipeptidyl aminopeptidase/acylaminoacyl peptidase
MKKTILILFTLFFLFNAGAQDLSQYEKKEFVRDGDTLRHRILYPLNYDKQKKYPLVMFLHGVQAEKNVENSSRFGHTSRMFV